MNLGVSYSCHTFNALLQVAKWYNNVSCVDPNQIHEKRRRPLRKARVWCSVRDAPPNCWRFYCHGGSCWFYQKGVTHNPTATHQNPTKTYQSYNKAHRHWHILKLWQISWLLHGFVWPIPWLVPATRNECQFEHGGTSINRPQWWIDWDLVDFVGVMSTLPCKTALLHAPTDSSPTPQFCSAIHWLGADLAAPWPR